MKRYLLFSGDNYYPSGGWYDFDESFDSLEGAREHIEKLKKEHHPDWAHIVDTETGNVFFNWYDE